MTRKAKQKPIANMKSEVVAFIARLSPALQEILHTHLSRLVCYESTGKEPEELEEIANDLTSLVNFHVETAFDGTYPCCYVDFSELDGVPFLELGSNEFGSRDAAETRVEGADFDGDAAGGSELDRTAIWSVDEAVFQLTCRAGEYCDDEYDGHASICVYLAPSIEVARNVAETLAAASATEMVNGLFERITSMSPAVREVFGQSFDMALHDMPGTP